MTPMVLIWCVSEVTTAMHSVTHAQTSCPPPAAGTCPLPLRETAHPSRHPPDPACSRALRPPETHHPGTWSSSGIVGDGSPRQCRCQGHTPLQCVSPWSRTVIVQIGTCDSEGWRLGCSQEAGEELQAWEDSPGHLPKSLGEERRGEAPDQQSNQARF